MFNHGALYQEPAVEGGNPITNASYVLILVKIFQESGVFPMEIREWSRLPDADKTVARCMSFFTEAFENRVEETLQGALLANAAMTTAATLTPTPPQKWDYCWSHGLCPAELLADTPQPTIKLRQHWMTPWEVAPTSGSQADAP